MNDQTDRGSRIDPVPATISHCPLCRSSVPDTAQALRFTDAVTGFTSCHRCHALLPFVDPGQVEEGSIEVEEEMQRRLSEASSSNAPSLAWAMAEHLNAPEQTEVIVDLAAGRGARLSALSRLGYSVQGCEPSAFLCQMARASYLLGPDVLTNSGPDVYLDRLEADPAPISAFVLWHLVDRHPDPIGLLRRCLDLAAGGPLFIGFPAVSAELTVPEQRLGATPRMLVHLADEIQAMIVSASLAAPGDLSVVVTASDQAVVDLDRPPEHHIDLVGLERAYRAASPVFEALHPDPGAESAPSVEPADVGGGR